MRCEYHILFGIPHLPWYVSAKLEGKKRLSAKHFHTQNESKLASSFEHDVCVSFARNRLTKWTGRMQIQSMSRWPNNVCGKFCARWFFSFSSSSSCIRLPSPLQIWIQNNSAFIFRYTERHAVALQFILIYLSRTFRFVRFVQCLCAMCMLSLVLRFETHVSLSYDIN